jgi:hypothetical protein
MRGQVVAARTEDLMIRLRVLLRGWIGLQDRDVGDFPPRQADRPRQRARQQVPRAEARRRPLVPYHDRSEDAGWRSTIDRVLRMSAESKDDAYRCSIFFRAVGIRVGDDLYEARRPPLAAGTHATLSLRFFNPHLKEEDVADCRLHVLTQEDAVRAMAPERFPLIEDVGIEIVGEQSELTIRIAPAAAEHTILTERLVTREAQATLDDDARATIEREHMLALFSTPELNSMKLQLGHDESRSLAARGAHHHAARGNERLSRGMIRRRFSNLEIQCW